MPDEHIKNLSELIVQHVGTNKDVVNTKLQPLLAPGENYFSNMMAVNLVLKDKKTGEEDVLQAVAKCLLPGPGGFTYHNELAFYKDIIPTLDKFRKDSGAGSIIGLFPKLYGFRANLHGNDDEVDENAVILLENLAVKGNSFLNLITTKIHYYSSYISYL